MIQKWINSIRQHNEFDLVTLQDVTSLTFSGDGEGDFEQLDSNADLQTVKEYIQFCHSQIAIAENYIRTQEDLKNDVKFQG